MPVPIAIRTVDRWLSVEIEMKKNGKGHITNKTTQGSMICSMRRSFRGILCDFRGLCVQYNFEIFSICPETSNTRKLSSQLLAYRYYSACDKNYAAHCTPVKHYRPWWRQNSCKRKQTKKSPRRYMHNANKAS